MNFKSSERLTEWVKRLPEVVSALNREETRLTGKKPVDEIKEKLAKISTTYLRPVGLKEERLEMEGGERRATDHCGFRRSTI